MWKTIARMIAVLYCANRVLIAGEIRLTLPEEGATVPQLAPIQKKYMELPRAEHAVYFNDVERRREMRDASTFPIAIPLAWEWDGDKGVEFLVSVADNPGFEKAIEIKAAESRAEVKNLFIGEKY